MGCSYLEAIILCFEKVNVIRRLHQLGSLADLDWRVLREAGDQRLELDKAGVGGSSVGLVSFRMMLSLEIISLF